MYHFMKDDPWGNKVPMMSISRKEDADKFLERNRSVITRVVEVPIGKQSIILM